MTKDDIQKHIIYHTKKIEKCINNYNTLYSKQYKLEKNRVRKVNTYLIRHNRMLSFYINELINF